VNETLEEWGMSESQGVETPGVTESSVSPVSGIDTEESSEDEEKMGAEDAAMYRRTAAKLNYISLDHPQIAYAAKEASRTMSSPEKGDAKKIKRTLRYLRAHPASVYHFA